MTFEAVSSDVAGVPLAALPVIVLDTETTGLDVDNARIIEFGAVSLAPAPAHGREFVSLVHPGIGIPEASSRIHGIVDADVAGAPPFPNAMQRLSAWAGPAVLIGFSIGFDLAVLKAEHRRHGLRWSAPRALDVRHLLEFLSPSLGALSLEAAAARFGVPVTERHRALADAKLAAAVFRAVLPSLRERGVHSLGDAERAIARRASQVTAEEKAGWISPRQVGRDGQSAAEYARIDSFAFRHRVGDLMSAPPLTISADTPLREALAEMASRRVSSLFVLFGGGGDTIGIVTERDVLRALAAKGAVALDATTGTFARRPLVTIVATEFIYRALFLMASRGFRHLGVADAEGKLVGALSARDLLRQRADDAIALGGNIETAATAEELGRVWLNLPKVARALDLEDVDARDIAAIISRELRAMTRRATEIAEDELATTGHGSPPAAYAMLVLGSGGRGESLLAMDQDNALVYAATPAAVEADAWFARLGQRVADILDGAGVSYCKGGVMASNAAWRMDVPHWRAAAQSWIARTRPSDILSCDIFFDARAVHGEAPLFEEVWSEAIAVAGASRPFLSLLALQAGDTASPFGWLGRLKLEHGRIDLKRFGLLPIFSAARVLALRHGIRLRATADRLRAAADLDAAPRSLVSELADSHRIFLRQILRQQLRDLAAGQKLTNTVAVAELSEHEMEELKWALRQVPQVLNLLGTPPRL